MSPLSLFVPPHPALRASVVVPARDEADRLPGLVAALGALGRPDGWGEGSVEALVLLNNCRDGSVEVAHTLAADRPWLRVGVVELAPAEAHVGRARQLVADAAGARLLALGRPDGLILSTDADSRPEPSWLRETTAEVARGAGAVCGRIGLDAGERAALAPGVRRSYLLDLGYRRAVERLRHLYAPDAHDPYPRHHQHYGASFAVRADAYARAGGLPPVRTSEDVALYRALVAADVPVRHSDRVRVRTSARSVGRAEGGLADAFAFWAREAAAGREPTVEPAADAEARLAALGLWRAERDDPAPDALTTTPDGGQPITAAIADLRARAERLTGLSLAERLDHARRLAPAVPLAA
ncbi:glycosyltransferase [Rubrivirga sp. IMCC43871]|uniref:glycosyltransferase n=1 Tax=Rubrivirga sp. IMCC43871 TaxID=3391575 RepID=UPI0039902A95